MAGTQDRRSSAEEHKNSWQSIAGFFRGSKKSLAAPSSAQMSQDATKPDVTQDPSFGKDSTIHAQEHTRTTEEHNANQTNEGPRDVDHAVVDTRHLSSPPTYPETEDGHQEPRLSQKLDSQTDTAAPDHSSIDEEKAALSPTMQHDTTRQTIAGDEKEDNSIHSTEKVLATNTGGDLSSPSHVPTEQPANVPGSGSSVTSHDLEAGNSTGEKETNEPEKDPFSVGWEGKDDPEYPWNWRTRRKGWIIFCLAMITLITPLASSMFAPGVPEVMKEFHSDSITLASFVVSVFLIGYVAGPLFVAPISEMYGRTKVYNISNVFFVIFTIACAVASNLNMLIGFRFLCGIAGSTPLVLGGGTIADLFPQERRGGVMAIWAMGPLLGPVLGPVAGGFIAEDIGWRWVFWVLAIFSGIFTFMTFCILRETYAPVLLERKAKRLREETGDNRYRSCMASDDTPKDVFKRSIIRPSKMLIFSPVVMFMSIYMAVVYGYLYLLFTTITEVYETTYHFSGGIVGLAYIGIGIGMFIGLGAFGAVSDRMVKAKMAKHGKVQPEVRLPPMIPGTLCIPIGLFWYGWSAEAKIHWIMPILGTVWIGLGLIGTFMPIQTYLVDSFTIYAASAVAANTIVRSLVGAILPLAGRPLYERLGLGWGNSVLAFIALAMVPTPILFLKYGEYLRTSERFKVRF